MNTVFYALRKEYEKFSFKLANKLRKTASLFFFMCWLGCTYAGSLGFRVNFYPQSIELTNLGSESAFDLRLYQLSTQMQWRSTSGISNVSQSLLKPGQTIVTQQIFPQKHPLIAADPLLLLFKDQSGSEIAHIAWRNTPSLPPELLIFQRRGAYVSIRHAPKTTQPYRRTWAISVPLQGISALAQSPDTTLLPPAPPTEIEWNLAHINEQTLTVDTGPGQGGIWLIHEAHNGQLSLQVIGNGILMGSEQKPAWLMFLKHHGYELALGLVVFGWLTTWMVRRLKCKARWVALLTAMRARFQLGTGV